MILVERISSEKVNGKHAPLLAPAIPDLAASDLHCLLIGGARTCDAIPSAITAIHLQAPQ